MPTLDEAFVIPRPDELSALDFVIRLDGQDAQVQRLVDDYVVTPAVGKALPELFTHLRKAVERGEAYGQWDPLESTCRHASLSIL